jgi:stress response protein SCP2
MAAQKDEILLDVDWDLLDPEPVSAPTHEAKGQIPEVAVPKQVTPISNPQRPAAVESAQTLPVLQAPIASSPPPIPPPLPAASEVSQQTKTIALPTCGKKLVHGERLDLGTIFAQKSQVAIELISSHPAAVKLICLGLDAAEIVAGAAYCVGPRQPVSPCGGVTHALRPDGSQEIHVRDKLLPTAIKRLEFSVVASDPGACLGNMVEGIRLRAGGVVIAEFTHLDLACASSACATLVEIYERRGTWRMRVIGEVLAGSVDELLAKHGAKAK